MPALPEILQPHGAVGLVEVPGEAISEQGGDADGDIGVGREVAIDLRRVAIICQQQVPCAVLHGVEKHIVRQVGREVIRQHDFLEKPAQDQENRAAGANIAGVDRPGDLRQEMRGPDDRTRHQLRKEGDIEQHVRQRRRPFDLAAVYIDHIGNAMEGEERNADGKNDVEIRDVAAEVEAFDHGIHTVQAEIIVFEITECREVGGDRESDP